jgi:hypothetical protein
MASPGRKPIEDSIIRQTDKFHSKEEGSQIKLRHPNSQFPKDFVLHNVVGEKLFVSHQSVNEPWEENDLTRVSGLEGARSWK